MRRPLRSSSAAGVNGSRRRFLQTAAASAFAFTFVPSRVFGANERLNIASIGVGGKGWTDANMAVAGGHNLVAFCDVVTGKNGNRRGGFAEAAAKWPAARRYQDWRKLLSEGQDIDAVTISTPDHMHAAPTLMAMRMGKHVYTQKPLTRTIAEARVLMQEAQRLGVKTQMGIQNQSKQGHRTTAQLIRQGVIGKIREIHCWSHKEWAGPPQGRPEHSDPVPANLNWDLWLGVAARRPYVEQIYQPGNWRGWIDFGSGTLGDMGIHIFEPTFSALGVAPPLAVRSRGQAPHAETWQPRNTIEFEFAGNQYTADERLTLTWRDGGGNRPPREVCSYLPRDVQLPQQGTLFIGQQGALIHPHIGQPLILPAELSENLTLPEIEPRDHYGDWRDSIIAGGQPAASFAFSAPLTETVLLGTVAVRFPDQRLTWDSGAMRFPDEPNANRYIRTEYRKGWEIDGLS